MQCSRTACRECAIWVTEVVIVVTVRWPITKQAAVMNVARYGVSIVLWVETLWVVVDGATGGDPVVDRGFLEGGDFGKSTRTRGVLRRK